jgi:parvulin-like peptidyl-prolyl isomerase
MGDATMLPPEFSLVPLREVARAFGQDFAERAAKLEPGQWSGPVASSYGLHLVFVRERVAGGMPDLATVRPLVEREVQAERRKAQLQALYDRFLANYAVTVEKAGAASVKAGASGGSAAK